MSPDRQVCGNSEQGKDGECGLVNIELSMILTTEHAL